MIDRDENGHSALDAGLMALRNEYLERPSAALSEGLLVEFDRERARQRRRRWAVNAALGLAAAVALAVLLGRHATREVAPRTAPVPVPLRSSVAIPVRAVSPAVSARPRLHSIARVHKARAPEQFIALPYADPLGPDERAEVYRVTMPAASLARYGLPVTYSNFDGSVTADLMVSQDGVARAIHFVQ